MHFHPYCRCIDQHHGLEERLEQKVILPHNFIKSVQPTRRNFQYVASLKHTWAADVGNVSIIIPQTNVLSREVSAMTTRRMDCIVYNSGLNKKAMVKDGR